MMIIEKLFSKRYVLSLAGWIGLLFSALSWFVYIGVYDHPNPVGGGVILFLGILLLWAGNRPVVLSLNSRVRITLILPLLFSILMIDWPFNVGMIIVSLYLMLPQRRIAQKLFLPGLIMVLQSGLFWISGELFVRLHNVGLWQYPFYIVLRVLGSDVVFLNNQVILTVADRSIPFVATYEQMGIPVFLIVLGSVAFLELVGTFEGKRVLWYWVIGGGSIYLFFRYVLLLLIYPFTGSTQIFWGTPELLISFIPLMILLGFCVHMNISPVSLNFSKFTLISGSLLVLGVTCFVCSFVVDDPGIPKEGRILIDEYHSQGWASVKEPLNTESFGGQRSVYTYYTLVNFLREFYSVDILDNPEKYKNLEEYDILIIKTPLRPFSDEVIEYITTFVEKGGGLLMLGDHTNLMNMSGHLNEISRQWGIEFVYDALFDLKTGGLTQYSAPSLFPHPISAGISNYKFATPCSLNINHTVRTVMKGRGLCSEKLDISHVHFFGELRSDPKDRWGWFVKAAARHVGAGRVIAFGDSTTFSTFSVLMHDNPEFILGIMNYLNRANRLNLRLIFLILGISFVALSVYFGYKKSFLPGLMVIFLLSMPVSLSVASLIHVKLIDIHHMSPVAEQLNSLRTIAFVTSHTTAGPGHFIGMPPRADNFSSFFLCFQRLGLWPREVKDLEQLLKEGNIELLVILNPDKPFSEAEINALENYVRYGGRLLLADSTLNRESTLAPLLTIFGLRSRLVNQLVTRPHQQDVQNEQTTSTMLLPLKTYRPARMGVIPRHHSISGFPTLRLLEVEYRTGRVFVVMDANMLSNAMLGDPGMPPTPLQFELHQKLFSAITNIVLGQNDAYSVPRD